MIKKQNFGIEIEMTGITRAKAAGIVAQVIGGTAGRPACNCYHTIDIKDNKGRKWKVMRDSSINPERNDGTRENTDEYRVEFVSPICQYEDIETIQKIVRELRAAGAKANKSCGIHVHIDGANHTPASLKQLLNFMINRQDLVYESLQIGDRGNHWCKRICKSLWTAIKNKNELTKSELERIWYSNVNDNYYGSIDHSHYNETRYHGVNLHAFFTKGTVEFRLFNGTMHAGRIKAYIQFCLAVSAWAIADQDKRVVFRSMEGYTAEQKVTIMKNILICRLGLTGDEFKTCRLFMLKALKEGAGMNTRPIAA